MGADVRAESRPRVRSLSRAGGRALLEPPGTYARQRGAARGTRLALAQLLSVAASPGRAQERASSGSLGARRLGTTPLVDSDLQDGLVALRSAPGGRGPNHRTITQPRAKRLAVSGQGRKLEGPC